MSLTQQVRDIYNMLIGGKVTGGIDGVYLDTQRGVTIANGGNGTPTNPVSNITDALTIATAKKLTQIYITSSMGGGLILDADLTTPVKLIGRGPWMNEVNLNAANIVKDVTFENLWLYGDASGAISLKATDCILTISNFINDAFFTRCEMYGITYVGGGGVSINAFDCSGKHSINASVPGSLVITASNLSGNLSLDGMTTGYIEITSSNLSMTIQNTVTGGDIFITGNVDITNLGTPNIYKDGQQPEIPINLLVDNSGETILLVVSTTGTHYVLEDLAISMPNTGADSITFSLIKGMWQKDIVVGPVTGGSYSLVDLFGVDHVAGDSIQVTATASANSYTITGSYTYTIT